MKHVVISGGAGFIGSHLSKRLLDEGHQVTVLDNLLTGNRKNIEDLEKNERFQFVEVDVTHSFDPILDKIEKIDEVYHLASPASPNKNSSRSYIAFPIETMLVNSVGTYNLLQIAKARNARFLFASSSEVYGDPEVSPQPESYLGNVSPNGLRSVYDEGKRFGEAMTKGFFRKYDQDTRIVRIFNTYGPQMMPDDGRVVSNFITQALSNKDITIYGDGSQTRSFCYVSDMVEGLKRMMEEDKAKGEVFNLGNPDERTIKEVAEIVTKLIPNDIKIVNEDLPEDDPKKRKPDITKAKEILGWEPQVSFEDGLKKTIEYFSSL